MDINQKNQHFFCYCLNLFIQGCTVIKKEMPFQKKKYIVLFLILSLLILGFVLMSGGGTDNPNVFSDEIFSLRRITLAPIIIIGSYISIIWLILKKNWPLIFGRNNRTHSDAELMQLIVSGDQVAFRELYHRYKDRLYYYFYRMLGNSSEQANDFLQELFMKIVEKPESYNPAYSFKTWLYSVANNICKNEYRCRGVRLEYHEYEALEQKLDFINEPAIEPEHVIEKIFQLLDQLGEEHRSAFLLRYREGFSVREVAEALQLPEGTVKSRLFYARKILADKLNYLKNEIEF
jgi:RNA polymerase sigma-70 factor, ECF subfamily